MFFLGCEVVLGPADVKPTDRVPVEQAIHSQKNLPGSGSLNTKVLADGPTRVLQVTDTWSQVRSQGSRLRFKQETFEH